MEKRVIPEICRVTPFNAGETAQIYGENLKNSVLYWWQPDTDIENLVYKSSTELPTLPPENAVTVTPDYCFSHMTYVRMSGTKENSIRSGCGIIWLKNDFGFSKPFVVNRPEIWSASLKTANPGDRVALFGSNFRIFGKKKCVLTGGNLSSPLNLFWGTEAELLACAPNTGDFKCEFRLPNELANGEYEIRMHNGTGGDFGWSNPYTLYIKNEKTFIEHCNKKWSYEPEMPHPFDMSKVAVQHISTEFGDGYTDATQIIQTAIDEVSLAGGGTVVLPYGIFGITETLIIKPNVVLKGAGRGATTLTVLEGATIKKQNFPVKYAQKKGNGTQWANDWKPLFDKRVATPLVLIYTNAGIEDMRIEDSNGAFATVMVGNIESDVSENVFFNRVDINEAARYTLVENGNYDPTYGVLTVSHTENFSMFKCSIVSENPLFMLHAKHNYAHLIGNTFDVSPRQLTEVSINGANNCMIEQNNFLNGRRTLMCQSSFNCNWIYQNRGSGVHRCGNALEAYMAENGGGAWAGKAETILPDGITTSFNMEQHPLDFRKRLGTVGENFDDHIMLLCIISGRGLGQYRKVIKIENNRIYLDQEWDVLPDGDTVFALEYPSWHNLWINNNQEMSGGHSQFFYGAGLDNVIAGHQMLLSAGIMSQASTHIIGDELVNYGMIAYNRFIGCETRASGKAIDFRSARYDGKTIKRIYSGQPEFYNDTMAIWGNVIRDNVFGGSSDLYYVKNQLKWLPENKPYCMEIEGAYNLIEGNHIFDYDEVFYLEDAGEGNYFGKNNILGAKKLFNGKCVPIGPDTEE